ncbi:MAG: SAM-dependent DNA methyltransferase [Balneolales bacterium]|nr:SAM-dependent DNA methyltransferase [Balneolales bacterium]
MPVKKSELYSSLWKSCDELRGSMDASQYKDYVLVLLFMKYVSDKGDRLVDIPEGGSFKDMVKLKGQPDIGDRINKIIGALARENDLNGIITVADFNDDEKLGKGKEKVDRLSNLIEIFENENLDFSSNRAENDDLLGDAYEYLMRHFATESGKSKGQFYTPAEVSAIMAKVIGIERSASASESLYDPTSGSGSLLLKASDEAPHGITIYGQEKDNATRALAVMNMWLHGKPEAEIVQGNTLADPQFTDEQTGKLKTFDYAVSNPPFSDKAWSNGLDAENDHFERFKGYGLPPRKNGDFAYLLHLIRSLKSTGKAAIIMPLGVLFRGNAESVIRRQLVERGYIKGIIGLPANLFYGTGIAACIIVIDKEDAQQRPGIFMMDASKGYMKDGNKNRLRSQDIHKMVDVFNKQLEIGKYSRLVPLSEIADPKNDYNLNIPRYIDSQEEEDLQDIGAHLQGGIPERDVQGLNEYWKVYRSLKNDLFRAHARPGYLELTVAKDAIKNAIFSHAEFRAYSDEMQAVFDGWKQHSAAYLKSLGEACPPKEVIRHISGSLLDTYGGRALVSKYDIYQILMDYWAEEMQDDLYELSADGWKAGNEVTRLMKKAAKKGGKDKEIGGIEGLEGRLIPPQLMIQAFFDAEKQALDALSGQLESVKAQMDEMAEEHTGEDGLLGDATTEKGSLTKGSVNARIKALGRKDAENAEEWLLLSTYKKLLDKEARLKAAIKDAEQLLEVKVIKQYPKLSEAEIKTVVTDKKWMATLETRIAAEMDAISYRLTERIKELAERYEKPLPALTAEVTVLKSRVEQHLETMGYVWES